MITTALIAASMLVAASDDWQTRPSIWLDIDPRPILTTEAGPTSYLGGAPYLPEDVAWPLRPDGTPYNFIAQINLAERPRLDDDPLPQSGLLLVFGHFFDGYAYPHIVHVEETEGLEPQIANAPQTTLTTYLGLNLLEGETAFDLAYPIEMYADTSLDEWSGPSSNERYDQLLAFEDERAVRRANLVADRFDLSTAEPGDSEELPRPNRSSFRPRTAMDLYRAGAALENRLDALSCGLEQSAGGSRFATNAIIAYREQVRQLAEQWRAMDASWRQLSPEEIANASRTWDAMVEATRRFARGGILNVRNPESAISFGRECAVSIALGARPVLDHQIIPTNLRYAHTEGVPVRSLYPPELIAAFSPDLEERRRVAGYYNGAGQMLGYATSPQAAARDNRDNILVLQFRRTDHQMMYYLGSSECMFHIWMTPEAMQARQFETAFATWECT